MFYLFRSAVPDGNTMCGVTAEDNPKKIPATYGEFEFVEEFEDGESPKTDIGVPFDPEKASHDVKAEGYHLCKFVPTVK